MKGIGLWIKQLLDYVAALLLLLILSPCFLLVALMIKLEDRGSVFFRQIRAGHFDRPFRIYKFRTMIVGADKISLEIEKNDSRITRVGKFLRNTSLDEIPQIINILRGEMSFIGPRPLLPGTVRPQEMKRQEMKPGITSYPALFGRHALDWDYRMQLDIWYAEHWSLWLDLKILFKTIPIVLSGKNVYDPMGESRFRPHP